jgi:hypothetical protein
MLSANKAKVGRGKYIRTEATRAKLRKEGGTRSEATRLKMRLAKLGNKATDTTRLKMKNAKLGKKRAPRTKEWTENLNREIQKYWDSPEGQKQKDIQAKKMTIVSYTKGKTWKWSSQISRDNASKRKIQYFIDHPEERNGLAERADQFYKDHPEIHRGAPFGKANFNYNGGITPYNNEWSTKTRYEILERDNYTCQYCCETEEEKKRVQQMDVHHKDGNKKNDDPDNLMTMHRKCHLTLEQHLITEFFNTIREMFEDRYKKEMSKLEMKDVRHNQDKFFLKQK